VSCCNDGTRAAISQDDIDHGLSFEIEYAGARTVTVVGSVTRTRYVFSGVNRLQRVDPRDAALLLRERMFRLKRVIPATRSR